MKISCQLLNVVTVRRKWYLCILIFAVFSHKLIGVMASSQLQKFFHQNLVVKIEHINVLSAGFEHWDLNQNFQNIFLNIPQQPFRVIKNNFSTVVENSNALNILLESHNSEHVNQLFASVTSNSLAQNVWIIPGMVKLVKFSKIPPH